MSENIRQQFEALPANLSNHMMITLIPLAIGICVSLPLAVLVVKRPRLRYPALTAVSVVQTIPSLALLALMVPLLAGISALTLRAVGVEIPALGFYPTVIALTLYSMLPMLRNAVTGILGVEPALIEAARGVGMTERQMLWKVQLPLAAPVIIAGVRTATVWVVGIATLATPVGQRCLGNYIFSGLQTRNWTAVLFGCVAAATLAIGLDLLIGGVEKAVKDRRRRLGVACAAALALIFAGGMVAPSLARWASRSGAGGPVVWIGAKTFTEQYILARLIADQLEDNGFSARTRESLGSTVVFDALTTGEIDCYVEYSGTVWANLMRRERVADADAVMREVGAWLDERHGVRALGALGFENAYTLAMPADRAARLGVSSINDLARHAPGWSIGGDYEFFSRPEWSRITTAYNLDFSRTRSFDATFMYEAVRRGEVDVVAAFSSDGRIAAYDLTTLDDPRDAIPPYDAILLLSPEARENPDIAEALEPLLGAVTIDLMRQANHMVDRDDNPATISEAAAWLRERALEE